jgi:hypothetical protein
MRYEFAISTKYALCIVPKQCRREWIVAPDGLAAIADFERRDDGPIPAELRLVARLGLADIVDRAIFAEGQPAFYCKSMVPGQLRFIRGSRAEGSFYPGLVDDLRTYRQGWRRWHRRRGMLRAASRRG